MAPEFMLLRNNSSKHGVNGTPGSALGRDVLDKGTPVVEFAVESHVTKGIDVGNPETMVDHIEAVQHDVDAFALGWKRGVIHIDRARNHVAGQRYGLPGLNELVRLSLLFRSDEIEGAELVVVPPPSSVVKFSKIAFDTILRWQYGS
ncbi:hypothetical protein C2W62_12705 [Candidatus Entotheonella serta]|nr:hypothetical protein C2W62_12705 [Candidatus Entotheonella serta]